MTSVIELTALAMEKRGYSVTRHDTCVEHRDSGFIIEPVFFDSPPSTTLVRANTAITISHPGLIPGGVFEYQHAFGKTLDDAIREGIDQWLQLDFVVFLDALRDTPEQCQALESGLKTAWQVLEREGFDLYIVAFRAHRLLLRQLLRSPHD